MVLLIDGIAVFSWWDCFNFVGTCPFLSVKNIVLSLIIVVLGLVITIFVYKHSESQNKFFARVKHRQLLARMIFDNKLYLTKTRINN